MRMSTIARARCTGGADIVSPSERPTSVRRGGVSSSGTTTPSPTVHHFVGEVNSYDGQEAQRSSIMADGPESCRRTSWLMHIFFLLYRSMVRRPGHR